MTAITPSSVDGIGWPAIPAEPAARLPAILEELARTQWWSEAELIEAQLRQAERLLAHAAAAIPFYRTRIKAAAHAPGRPLTLDAWRKLPILSRREVQAAGDALLAPRLPFGHGGLMRTTTSGSTGIPVRVVKTEIEQLLWHAGTLREELWHRRNWRGKIAVIRGFDSGEVGPGGRVYADWGRPMAELFATGPMAALDIRTPVADQAAWLKREQPEILVTFPSNLAALINHFRRQGEMPPPLGAVRTLSEVVDRRLRRLCREIWNIEIADTYSASEIGYIGLQCPEHPHFHVQSETALVEVLDEAGGPCPAGATGRVVVTPLQNFAMPLIRYEIGDYAEVGSPCACGRGLPVIARILGRAKDNLVLPSGVERHAWLGTQQFAEIDAIIQHQVIQKSLSDLEVRLVVKRPLTPAEEAFMRETLVVNLGHELSVAFRYMAEIPRAPSGKFFEFLSEVTPPTRTGT